MHPTAGPLRLSLMTSIQALQTGAMNIVEAIRTGSWREQQYQLLEGARERSRYYYSRTTKRTWAIAGLVTSLFLFLWYLITGPPLPATFHRPFVATDERSCFHPVARLVSDASTAFNETLQRQSKSLDEAVTEYRRRYNMPPPPHFDKWYDFAAERNTLLIDEYDTIYHSLLPFWGLAPSTIRSRVREDLGYDNVVMGISIRNGRPIHLGNGQGDSFQRDATMKILEKFSQWLPNMDVEFNAHDEPRVVVPHEELHSLVAEGSAAQARLNGNSTVLNLFSAGEVVDPIPQVLTSRFNNFERQETWLYSRLSCPLDSPARDLNGNAPDNSTAYAIEPLGFIFNQTAASDICLSPSLRHRLDVFERPNAFKLTNELVPMFSTSHPSSFQDIAVPSPYYYKYIASFDDGTSVPWDEKKNQLYWRGGTTGHSRGGSWRNLQRQRVIGDLTHPETTQYVLERKEHSTCSIKGDEAWEVQPANQTIRDYFDIHSVEIVDCDEDCSEEELYFEKDDQSEAWKYKYLLDMDGHAYSPRFYAFMRSKSVPLKLTFFREWHENVLVPWVHYVPLNKDANEIPELIRFFDRDPAGQEIARTIGEEGQAWAYRTIRNDDMEVYMFRLFLEYVVPDARSVDMHANINIIGMLACKMTGAKTWALHRQVHGLRTIQRTGGEGL